MLTLCVLPIKYMVNSLLTAGFSDKLGHVKSFCLQCEMIFNDDIKFVDNHFDIQYGNHSDRIYVTSNGPICYICKIIDHILRTYQIKYHLETEDKDH